MKVKIASHIKIKFHCDCGKRYLILPSQSGEIHSCLNCGKQLLLPNFQDQEVLGIYCNCGAGKIELSSGTCTSCHKSCLIPENALPEESPRIRELDLKKREPVESAPPQNRRSSKFVSPQNKKPRLSLLFLSLGMNVLLFSLISWNLISTLFRAPDSIKPTIPSNANVSVNKIFDSAPPEPFRTSDPPVFRTGDPPVFRTGDPPVAPTEEKSEVPETISVAPENHEVCFKRGQLRFQRGEYIEAIMDYSEAIQYHPQAAYYLERGKIKEQLKELRGAEDDYRKASELENQKASSFYLLGDLLLKLKRDEEAIATLENALKLEYREDYVKKIVTFYQQRGDQNKTKGILPSALENYLKALSYAPKEAKLFYLCGDIYFQLGNPEKAVEYWEKGFQIQPDPSTAPKITEYYKKKAIEETNKNQFEQAIQSYQKTIVYSPNEASLFFKLGELYWALEKMDEAIGSLEKGLLLKTEKGVVELFTDLLAKRMAHYYSQKKFQEAKADGLLFKKFAPANHPKQALVDQLIQRSEKQLSRSR